MTVETGSGNLRNPGIQGLWSRQAMAIVILCFVLNMVDGMDLLIISFIAPRLQDEWAVGPTELSIVFSSGLAGMAVGGLALAPMADRLGRRRLIVTALALMTVAMAASSLARSVAELAGIRFFVGCGIGTVLACIAAVAARSAPAEHRNFAVGILQGGYPVGAMITGFVTAWALPRYGWQHCLLGVAGVSALFVPLALAVLPREAPVRVADGHPPLSAAIAGPRRRATMLLWATTISGFMALYFITSWITRLAIAAGLPETQAIVASAVYNLGAFLGTLVMSLMGVKRDIRRICSTMLVCAAGMFLVFGGVKMGLAGVLVTAFLTGVTLQGGYNMVYPIVARVYPDDLRATGIGWAFGVGRIGAFIGPMLGGWALAMQWPLVAVFGIFCVPLLVAAAATRRVAFD